MLKVRKRDESIVEFDLSRIEKAIERAFVAEHKEADKNIIELLALRVTAEFNKKVNNGIVDVEDIQDSVEIVLIQAGYVDVAHSYMDYRKKHADIREIKKTELNYATVVDNYLKISDWRVKENSTVTYSVGGLILSNSGAVTANYWLSQVYDKEIGDAHRNADIHIHDLSMLTGYCAGWSLKQLIQQGLGGVPGKITSTPAGHLSTLCNQMVNFLGIMQNE
ncbi:MAG: ribonucleoside triphosphate reductase, partial [Bacilli bacterium]|nr:ribonucleoside triphosphate reductase [Bacilli bacterium]